MANSLDHLGNRTRAEWLAQLNTEYVPAYNHRRTSIIGTIGPKTNSVQKINMLRTAGLNVVRMNFSHGSYEYHQSVVDNAREAARTQQGRPLAIALDTKGPEIRTGNTVNDQDFPIKEGAVINVTTDEQYKTASDEKNMCAQLLLSCCENAYSPPHSPSAHSGLSVLLTDAAQVRRLQEHYQDDCKRQDHLRG